MNITYFYFDILRRIPGTTNTEYEVNWRIHNVGETTHENDPFIIYARKEMRLNILNQEVYKIKLITVKSYQ